MNWQEFLVPNLDDIPECEVKQWEETFDLLRRYCMIKGLARDARKEGNISLAVIHEGTCDVLYKRIPQEIRW